MARTKVIAQYRLCGLFDSIICHEHYRGKITYNAECGNPILAQIRS